MHKILLLEDDAIQIRLLGAVFKQMKTELRQVRSAEEALTSAIEWNPDLIISDIALNNNPRTFDRMDDEGLCFVEIIKNDPITKNIPVILFSASPLGYFEKTMESTKADYWLPKPLDIDVLRALVERCLKIEKV